MLFYYLTIMALLSSQYVRTPKSKQLVCVHLLNSCSEGPVHSPTSSFHHLTFCHRPSESYVCQAALPWHWRTSQISLGPWSCMAGHGEPKIEQQNKSIGQLLKSIESEG